MNILSFSHLYSFIDILNSVAPKVLFLVIHRGIERRIVVENLFMHNSILVQDRLPDSEQIINKCRLYNKSNQLIFIGNKRSRYTITQVAN